jgi:hypothetical protein
LEFHSRACLAEFLQVDCDGHDNCRETVSRSLHRKTGGRTTLLERRLDGLRLFGIVQRYTNKRQKDYDTFMTLVDSAFGSAILSGFTCPVIALTRT